MNVIVSNEKSQELSYLDIDIIKSISGTYDALEIVEMFKSFFFSKMILDVTAINNNTDLKTYELIARELDVDKIIFLMPEGSKLCTASFLANLISFGIYNFTSNIKGVLYLLKKSNTLQDVEHIVSAVNIQKSNETGAAVAAISTGAAKRTSAVIGIKNVTESAGATTFVYLLKKELSISYGKDGIVALEVDKQDFAYFNETNMFSVSSGDLKNAIEQHSSANIILIDLNNYNDESICKDIVYLIEPSTLRLNKLLRRNKLVFSKLVGKKVILNQSLLLNNDLFDFERESGIKIFYNMPPLDERKRNAVINDFLNKLGLFSNEIRNINANNRIFGLFRR